MVNPIKVIKGLLEVEQALADFIQSGPSTGLPGYVRDRYRHRCNEFANLPPWARALSGITGGSISRFCDPYWNDNGWDGPVAEPPFTGGQCPINYDVSWERRVFSGAQQQYIWSPQTLIGAGFVGPVTLGSIADPGGCSAPDSYAGVTALPAQGNPITIVAGCVDQQPGYRNLVFTPTNPGDVDDCGDPPAPIEPGPNPPPNPGPLPGPEPRDNPDPENPIPFFPIPPFDDPVFGPLPITGPSDDFDPTPAPNPTAGGDGLPGDGGAIGGAAGEVTGDGEGEEIDFGPPPEGRIWVGCIVDLTADSRIGNIPGTGPQSTVWPSVRGNVALKYSTLFGSSQRINSRYTELFRPNTALTVTGCFLQVQPGGAGIVFPISALTCPETPCGEQNG